MYKTFNSHYKVLPWWGHGLVLLLAPPIEIIIGSIEIHKLRQESNHYHSHGVELAYTPRPLFNINDP